MNSGLAFDIVLFCILGIPAFFRVAEILHAITKGEYDYRTKGRFHEKQLFWFYSSYMPLLVVCGILTLIETIGGEKRYCWFLNFWFVLALSFAIELFFRVVYGMLNACRSTAARRLRKKWRKAAGPPLELSCPPEPDRAPCQGCSYNGRQIDFDLVCESDRLRIVWDLRESQLIRADIEKAKAYLKARQWYRNTLGIDYGMGIGGVFGVFLFRVETDSPEGDKFLWVVAGDIPATHFSCENARSPRQALRKYLDAMASRLPNGNDETDRAVRKRLELLEKFLAKRSF